MLFGTSPATRARSFIPTSPQKNAISPKNDGKIFQFYTPADPKISICPAGPINVAKQNKVYSQSFSRPNLPNWKSEHPISYNEQLLTIPKRIQTEGEKSESSVGQNGKKKTFFTKSDGKKSQKNQENLINFGQNIIVENKTKSTKNLKTFQDDKNLHINKNRISNERNKTESIEGEIFVRAKGAYRVSEMPMNISKNEQFYVDPENQKRPRIHKLNLHTNTVLCESFGPSNKQNLQNPINSRPEHYMTKSTHKFGQNTSLSRKQKKSTSILKNEKIQNHCPKFLSHKSASRFHIIRLIGNTQFSQSFLCVDKKSYSIYCLKRIKKSLLNQSPIVFQNFIKKLLIQLKSVHPNIIQIYDLFCDSEYFYILQEYIQGGNLRKHLISQRSRKSSDYKDELKELKKQPLIAEKIYHITSALNFMHNAENPRIHGNLRPETILMNLGTCKISPVILFKNKSFQQHCYICPEALTQQNLTTKSDMWNLGLILFELALNRELFKIPQNKFSLSLSDQILYTDFQKQVSSATFITNSMKQLLINLLRIRPQDRLNTEQVLESSVVKIHGVKSEDFNEKKNRILDHPQIDRSKLDIKSTQTFIPRKSSNRESSIPSN